MPVFYGNYDLRPCETVDFSQQNRTTEDGRFLGRVTRANLKGCIVPEVIDGVFEALDISAHLSMILTLQEQIRQAFAIPGKLLEVQGWDGTVTAKFPAQTISVDFLPGNWIEKCDYEIVMEGLEFTNDGATDYAVESASESWSFEQIENPKITKATHTVQAKGVTLYDGNGNIPTLAWQQAKAFVQTQLGLGWTTVGQTAWGEVNGQTLANQSASLPSSTTPWNYTVVETIDELGGTYQAVETWLLNPVSYWEESVTSTRKSADQPGFVTTVAISGTIHGLFATQGAYDTRLTNAIAGWAIIEPTLASRANTAAGITLNPHPITFSFDENQVEGTVSYQIEFNDRVLVNDTWELYTIAERASLEDYRTEVTIEGTIFGALYPDEDPNNSLIKLTRAQAQFSRIEGLLYARVAQSTGLANLQLCPLTAETTANQEQGTVSYSFTFDNRLYNTVNEEFTVVRRFTSDDPRTSVTVEGTIKGLRTSTGSQPFQTPSQPFEAFNNAQTYFNGIQAGLLSRATIYIQTNDINPVPWSSSVSQNQYAGTISYSYEFTTQRHCYPFALSEVITVSEEAATEVIAIVPVIGRKQGPVIQDMGTVKEQRRTLNIELVLPIPASPCGYQEPPAIDITPFTPTGSVVFLEQCTTQWSYTSGHMTLTASWVYEI